MEIGQIFLKLGIQAAGMERLGQFEAGATQGAIAAEGLADALSDMVSILGKIAVKMGAMVEKDLPQFRKQFDKATESEKKGGVETKKYHTEVEKAGKHTRGLKDRFTDLLGPMNMARVQIAAAGAALTAVSVEASKVAANLTKFQNVTGLSGQQLQAWQQDAAASGVEAEELAGAVAGIQAAQTDLTLGAGNMAPWAMLGIDPRQDPFEVLNKLKSKLKEMPAAYGTKFARDMGLSDNVINFLKEARATPAGDRDLLLSPKETERLKAFNMLWLRLLDNIKRSFQKLGSASLPVANQIVDWGNRMAKTVLWVANGVEYVIQNFKTLAMIVGGIGIAIAVAFFPVTAAVIAAGLVIEDLMVWAKGGDSVTGRMIGPFKNWKKDLEDAKKVLDDILTLVRNITDAGLQKIADLFTEVNVAEGAPSPGVGGGAKALGVLGKVFGAMGEYSANAYNDIKKGVKGVGTIYDIATGADTGGGAPGGTTVNNDVKITVNGAGDPARVAAEVKKAIDATTANGMRGVQAAAPQTAGGK